MRVRDAGMIEVALGIRTHADPRHHGGGASVGRNGDGNDLPELPLAESIIEKRPRCLRHVALSPMAESQAPADLDGAVGQVRFEVGACKSAEADRRVVLTEREREEAEAGFADVAVVAVESASASARVRRNRKNSMTAGSLLISAKSSRSVSIRRGA